MEWLVSLDDPDVSFAVLEPFLFETGYAFELADREVEALGMHEAGDAVVRCLLTLNEDPEQITAKLLAPLVFSRRTHMARQVILSESTYSMRDGLRDRRRLGRRHRRATPGIRLAETCRRLWPIQSVDALSGCR